jgi:hypothetical protein
LAATERNDVVLMSLGLLDDSSGYPSFRSVVISPDCPHPREFG